MDFTLTDEQQLLRDSARGLLQKECPASLVRATRDDPSAADPLWKHLREWVGLADGSFVDLCLFLEESGAVLAPGPFFATTLFASLLKHFDHKLLPKVLAGEITGTVAFQGPIKAFVPEADRVDYVAIVRSTTDVLLVERPAVKEIPTMDWSKRMFEVEASDGEALKASDEAIGDVLERAYVGVAAEMMGATKWIFDTTLDYAKHRHQFDRPIGSFQAIKHKLANMKVELERAWSAVYYAAMTIDADDPDRHRAAHAAKISAGEAAKLNSKDGIQIHGGIGYTWEHDLHLYMRRAYALEHFLGTSGWHSDRLADLIF